MGLVQSIADRFFRSVNWNFRSTNAGLNKPHRLGREGERLAARFLRRNGYKVLYRNFRAPHGGEVDIVCRDKTSGTLVFVEVKARTSLEFGHPSEAVTAAKQKLISRGALAWLRMLGNPEIYFRFDIVEVLITGDGSEINLIKGAFTLSEPYRY